ncbi:HAD-IA family hydrolase [Verrucomicrobiota bacterium sgz303538]
MQPHVLSRPKIIFFDAAGTLIHLPRGAAWHYHEVVLRHGIDIAEDRLSSAFRTAWKSIPSPVETRSPREDDDKSWWRGLVDRVLDQCDVPPGEGRAALFESLYIEFEKPGVWELYPETVEVIEGLAGSFRLGIISNFDRRLVKVLEHEGLMHFFDPVVLSSEVGADKPAPWIYEQALLKANVSASEALHVGDDPECDWKGARAAGLNAFHLDRPRNSLRELTEFLRL